MSNISSHESLLSEIGEDVEFLIERDIPEEHRDAVRETCRNILANYATSPRNLEELFESHDGIGNNVVHVIFADARTAASLPKGWGSRAVNLPTGFPGNRRKSKGA